MHLSGCDGMINRATCLSSVGRRYESSSEVVGHYNVSLCCLFFFFFTSSQSVPLKCVNFKFICKEFH